MYCVEINGRNKFIVSDQATEVGGIRLSRKECTLTSTFRTGVGRCSVNYARTVVWLWS